MGIEEELGCSSTMDREWLKKKQTNACVIVSTHVLSGTNRVIFLTRMNG